MTSEPAGLGRGGTAILLIDALEDGLEPAVSLVDTVRPLLRRSDTLSSTSPDASPSCLLAAAAAAAASFARRNSAIRALTGANGQEVGQLLIALTVLILPPCGLGPDVGLPSIP